MWSDFMDHLPEGYATQGYRAVSYWSSAPLWLKLLASVPNSHFRQLTARVAIKRGVVVLMPDETECEVKADQVKHDPIDGYFLADSTMRLVKPR